MMNKIVRHVGEVVTLTRDCELGWKGEIAVVVGIDEYMRLVFPNRPPGNDREVKTGSDYTYLRRS